MFGTIRARLRTIPLTEIALFLLPFGVFALLMHVSADRVLPQHIEICSIACRNVGLGVLKVDVDSGDCFCGGYGPIRKLPLSVEARLRMEE